LLRGTNIAETFGFAAKIRKMGILGKLFGKTRIEIVTFDPTDRAILFKSDKDLSRGEHQVQAQVADQTLKCKVLVESVEAELFYGKFLAPENALEPLSVLLPKPKGSEEQRSSPRIDRIVRVCSAHIPEFQAVTVDLSLSGMKLSTAGPMEPETFFECEIEFDDHTMTRLPFNAQVKWSRQVEQHWEVGVQFVETPKSTMSRLAYFIKALTEVERGVLKGSYQVFD
jgi:PilZ domain-containing protein